MTEITMPKLSDTMTEGRLISWKKGIGDRVERGDIIAEVETDKANMELEAFASGILLEVRVTAGEMVPVGTVIAVIGGFEEKTGAQQSPAQAAEPPPIPATWQPPPPEPPHAPFEPGDVPERVADLPESVASAEKSSPDTTAASEKASPLVRRLAREKGIDLAVIQGSGPEGRVLQEDLEAYVQAQGSGHETPGMASPGEATAGGTEEQPLSPMRAAIARTVNESWRTIPHFSVTVEVRMEEAEEIVREMKGTGHPVTINDLIIKASAMALQKFPRVNSYFAEDRIMVNSEINIGFAVSLDEGLLIPVIKGCRVISLMEIAERSRELATRARSGTLSVAEMSGGTFTISNLGMYGVEEFMAVIHPHQGGILAVGAIRDEAVARDGRVSAARTMHVTLSADHRLLDGVQAAQFLGELKKILENPVVMLL